MKTLAKAVLTWPSEDLLAEMSSNMVPAGPINSVGENLTSEHAIARGLVIDPEGVKGVRTPIIFSDAELKLKRSVPR